jgi:hypothetical protein
MSEGLDPGSIPMPPPTDPGAETTRSPLLFLLLCLTFFTGALLSSLALTAALYWLGVPLAFGLSTVLTVVLPVFLVLRANAALKRRRFLTAVRHIVSILLAAATHAALFGVALDWVDRNSGDVFLVAKRLLDDSLGEVPVISGILKRGSEDATITLEPSGDGGPTAGDGGPTAGDGGPAAATRDGGPVASAKQDAGKAPAGDAGSVPAPWTERKDEGRIARTVVSQVRTDTGDYALVVTEVKAGGAHKHRVVDVTKWAAEGGPTAAQVARDGTVAAVLASSEVVLATGQHPRKLKALSRGGRLSSEPLREIRAVHGLIVGEGGALLEVADVFEKMNPKDPGKTVQMLLAYDSRRGAVPNIVRRGGDEVPDASNASVAGRFEVRRPGVAGRFVVIEEFFEGGSDLGNSYTGERWSVNPRRLLVGRLDKPEVLTELARTNDAISGIPSRAVQLFGSAGSFADGRVLVDGNFVENGFEGTLLIVRSGQGPTALAAAAVRDGKAAWPKAAPRAMHLDTEPDGTFAFTRPTEGIVLGEVDRAEQARLFAAGGTALRALDFGAREVGAIGAPEHPVLGQGGDLVLYAARTGEGADAARTLLLSSRKDLERGVAEVLLREGDLLPGSTDKRIRSLGLYDDEKSPLWQAP